MEVFEKSFISDWVNVTVDFDFKSMSSSTRINEIRLETLALAI